MSLAGALYDELDIDDGLAIARSDRNHQATGVAGLAKLTGCLADVGIIDEASGAFWAAMRLVPGEHRHQVVM